VCVCVCVCVCVLLSSRPLEIVSAPVVLVALVRRLAVLSASTECFDYVVVVHVGASGVSTRLDVVAAASSFAIFEPRVGWQGSVEFAGVWWLCLPPIRLHLAEWLHCS